VSTAEWATIITAAGGILGGGGWFVARATVKAARVTKEANEAVARIQAQPAAQQASLAVLEATVRRVDKENEALRTENQQIRERQTRMERILKAFSWTLEDFYRWARNPVGDPPPVHPLVDEYNRTGV